MPHAKLAIIGGSGFDNFEQLIVAEHISQDTPYGSHSIPIMKGNLSNGGVNNTLPGDISQENEIFFLPRHGAGHQIPPHLVNYRANICALSQLGVKRILACSAVGGISASMPPGTIVVPSQIIDYTYGREHTFFDGEHQHLQHIDFTEPYSRDLRDQLLTYLHGCQLPYRSNAVYGCTQGPRLETAAEIKRMQNDGCDIVGMTAMPEAVLAREIGIEYAGLSLVVNWAAGVETGILSMDSITEEIETGMKQLKTLLPGLIRSLALAVC